MKVMSYNSSCTRRNVLFLLHVMNTKSEIPSFISAVNGLQAKIVHFSCIVCHAAWSWELTDSRSLSFNPFEIFNIHHLKMPRSGDDEL